MPTSPPSAQPAIRVLYVDDSRFDRELVRDALELEEAGAGGFVLAQASSRAEFEAALDRLDTDFDLILTDFNILGFTGLNVLHAVRARRTDLPVIVVTGTGSEEIAVAAMKAGASDYVIKTPQHIRRLPTTIRNVLAHYRAVADRQDAAAAVREARARLDLAMEAGHMGAFDWDLRTGRIVWTGQHDRIFGLAPGEFDGRYETFARIVDPDDLPAIERKIQAARDTRTVFEHEYRVIWPDKSVHWVIGRGMFLYDAAGQAFRMTGVAIDVTPRREAEEASRGLQTQVAHLLRLNLLSQIASGLAHEINQPLTAISNFVGAALRLQEDGKLSTDRGADILREIASQAHRAGEIVRRLRNFIRGKPNELAPTDLNAMISDALGLLSHELSASRVKAKLEAGARIPKLRVDAVQIQQVLVNLIQNAIDAMRDVPADRRRLTISTIPSIGQVIVRVTDSGPGIAPENLEHVFESFFSTKDHGLGMGLNISRSIVESHGGSLTASNAPDGAGAVFEFVLPIEDPPDPAPA